MDIVFLSGNGRNEKPEKKRGREKKGANDQRRDEESRGGSAFRVVRRRGRTKWIKWIERDYLIKRARGALLFAKNLCAVLKTVK